MPRIANAIGRGLKAQADDQTAKKRKEWVRPTAAEVKSLRDKLATAETQRDEWRKTAKTKVFELAKAESRNITQFHANERYVEHHMLHNIVGGLLFAALVVSVAFNIWG